MSSSTPTPTFPPHPPPRTLTSTSKPSSQRPSRFIEGNPTTSSTPSPTTSQTHQYLLTILSEMDEHERTRSNRSKHHHYSSAANSPATISPANTSTEMVDVLEKEGFAGGKEKGRSSDEGNGSGRDWQSEGKVGTVGRKIKGRFRALTAQVGRGG